MGDLSLGETWGVFCYLTCKHCFDQATHSMWGHHCCDAEASPGQRCHCIMVSIRRIKERQFQNLLKLSEKH